MNRTILGTLLILCLLMTAPGHSQTVAMDLPTPVASLGWTGEPGEQEGPDHTLYKKGYDLVLDEKWNAARKQFAELLEKYPKSNYSDDARYWSAYALMHTDLKAALKNYEEFVKQYPKSSYVSDAVADMQNIKAQLELARVSVKLDSLHIRTGVAIPDVAIAPKLYDLNSRMWRMNRNLYRMQMRMDRSMANSGWRTPIVVGETPMMVDEEKLDAKTRLKLDALQAIGENTEDEKGFSTLKEIALDPKQLLVMRQEALYLLSRFKNHDIDAVYLDLARRDTSEEIQILAIDNIGQSSQDKNKTIETLKQLYSSIPARKEKQRAATLYRVADIGNDRAVDFLADVAKNDSNYDLRSDAVYYLGNIGGDKAKAVLYDILRSE